MEEQPRLKGGATAPNQGDPAAKAELKAELYAGLVRLVHTLRASYVPRGTRGEALPNGAQSGYGSLL